MKDMDIRNRITEKALAFGACMVGITTVALLRKSPSHLIYWKLGEFKGVGTKPFGETEPEKFAWPEGVKSVIIIAVEHPEERPELDWFQEKLKGGTPGNRILMTINAKLTQWLKEDLKIEATGLPYYIEQGGVFLKDAAVLAGLGCIGKNNLLVTPGFGPRVRVRAMLISEMLPQTDRVDFDPCKDCRMPCREACPQSAFLNKTYSENEFGLSQLPARTGVYNRNLCNTQMEEDILTGDRIAVQGETELKKRIKYCRRCETACPVGKPG